MTDIQVGDAVVSQKGRDAGRLMLVLSAEDPYLFVADGRMRRAEQPKKKKMRHVQWVDRPPPHEAEPEIHRIMGKLRSGETVTNKHIRRVIRAVSEYRGIPERKPVTIRRDADVKG